MKFNVDRFLTVGGGGLVGFSILIGFLGFNEILKFGIKDQTSLRKRNEIKKIYLKLPFPLDFSLNFFNVTNPNEVMNGAKPILKEIGPYVYSLYKEKVDIVENVAEDTLTYSPYDLYYFNKTKSGNLSENDYVTILHPLIVGAVNTVLRDSPQLLGIINKALDPLFDHPSSIYLTCKVRDLLFDGIPIYCNGNDFSLKAVCTQLKQLLESMLKPSSQKGVVLFSLLSSRNATIGDRFTVLRGIKNSHDVGRLVAINSEKQISMWGSEICNRFRGTDGWIFPPLLKKEEGIWSYSTDLCRSLGLVYVKDTVRKGLDVGIYEGTLGDQEHNEEDKCYCGKTCAKKGLFDLTNCMGAPIYASLPHFFETDESIAKQVDGLNPDPDLHSLRVYFQAMIGAPIEAKKRMQLNLPIKSVPKITLMKDLPEAMHPIFWIEESFELQGDLFDMIASVFILIKVAAFAKWAGLVIGGGMLGAVGYRRFQKKGEVAITPVKTANDDNDNNSLTEKKELHALDGEVNHAMSSEENNRF